MSETTADVQPVDGSPLPELKDKTYEIVTKDKSFKVTAKSVAWTENGQFLLLMDGENPKHVVVAANVIAVTET